MEKIVRTPSIGFIVGPPRSGTTLVREVLNNHPDIAITPETRFFRYWSERALGMTHVRRLTARRHAAAQPWKHWGQKGEMLLSKEYEPARTYAELFRSVIHSRVSKESASIYIEKTPNHALFVDIIRAWYRDAPILFIMRDGREVVASASKKWHTKSGMYMTAALWSLTADAASACRRRDDPHTLFVTYEDVTDAPERTFEKIFAHFGCTFSATYTETVPSTSSFGASEKQGVKKSEHARTFFTDDEYETLSALLSPWLRQFGYAVSGTPRAPRGARWAFFLARTKLRIEHALSRLGIRFFV